MSTRSLLPSGLAQRAEPESFRARTLSASLTVKDIQKSLTWYRDKVGFSVEQKFERDGKLRAVSLKVGDVRVLISQEEPGSGWDRVKGAGFTLQFTTAQDIDLLAQAIKARGGTVELEPADASGGRALRLRDPDGFRLVISKAK
jgi:uncharacterized glyoxalase superfamily protein PhnB